MEKEIMNIETLMPLKDKMIKAGFSPQKFQMETSFAIQIYNDPKNVYLRKATKKSFLIAVNNIAHVNLTLNPISKEANLIPRYDNISKQINVHLEPTYIGIKKLIEETGLIKSIQTNLVYANDDFDVFLGLETNIKHKPYYVLNKKHGELIGVYSVCKLLSNEIQYEYMTTKEIHEIRNISTSWQAYQNNKTKSCIWNDFEGEMFKKTVIKRLAKYLPRAGNMSYLNKAIELCNSDYEISSGTVGYIESLLSTSNLLESQKEQIERELPTMMQSNANDLIKMLKDNQIDPIESGLNYNQTDIINKLNDKLNNPKA